MAIHLLGACCVLLLLFVPNVKADCAVSDWSNSLSNKDSLAYCTGHIYREYLRGFSREAMHRPDPLSRLTGGLCCKSTSAYAKDLFMVNFADWRHTMSKEGWSHCPRGFFLNGMYREEGLDRLQDIKNGRCMKPASAPINYGHCYEMDLTPVFNKKETVQCNDDYYITGLYRHACPMLSCIDKFKCCKMGTTPIKINSLETAKIKVMDYTQFRMAWLANYLGFAWARGCRAFRFGEDFNRNGDTWEADTTPPCKEPKGKERLKIKYSDWGFLIKEVVYGDPLIQDLQPESIDGGTISNEASHPVTSNIARTSEVTRSVSHTTTSDWSHSHELGLEVGYNPPDAFGGFSFSASYTFNYAAGFSTEDSNGQEDISSFAISQEITIPANEAVKWTLILAKTRRTVPYTLKVLVTFSVEFQGFMKYGGGYYGEWTNYHREHRGNEDRPSLKFKFGNSNKPFYTDLWDSYTYNRSPWMWADLEAIHSKFPHYVRTLAAEGPYEFLLTGKFDDVQGKDVYIEWEDSNGRKRRSAGWKDVTGRSKRSTPTAKVVATQQDGDPAEVFPDPPAVSLDPVGEVDDVVEETSDDSDI